MADAVREVRIEAHPSLTTGIPDVRGLAEVSVLDTWRELGLPSQPRIETVTGTLDVPVTVSVDGERLPLSARRMLTLTWAATEKPYTSATVNAQLCVGLLGQGRPGQRARALSWLTEATLKAALPRLVQHDHDLFGPVTKGVTARQGVALAAELGLAPSQLPLGDVAIEREPDAREDPWVWCELMAQAASDRLGVTIQLNRGSLRRITTGPGALAPEMFVSVPQPHTRGIFDALFAQYGARVPGLAFEMTDAAPDDVAVFRFGGVGSSPVRLLPDGVEAIKPGPGTAPTANIVGFVIDPVYGKTWPLVPAASAERLPSPGRYGQARFLLRALLAEFQCRLAWYPPDESSSLSGTPWLPSDGSFGVRSAGALRWLLADRATIHYADPIWEGTLRAFVSGRSTVPELVSEARQALQGGVLGPVALEAELMLIVPTRTEIERCLGASSIWPLLDRYPTLRTDPRTQVVAIPAAARDRIQRLLRALADTVVVVAREELSRVALPPPTELMDVGRDVAGNA